MIRTLICFAAIGLMAPLVAQEKNVKIRQVSPSPTSPTSGAEMFKAYCSSCHGLMGVGNGPAAPALKTLPANLTTLSKGNAGKFPSLKIYNSIEGDNMTIAHGSKDMPVWGDVLRSMSRDEGERRMRLHNLTKYIESIQVK